jgi:hypothetical protein
VFISSLSMQGILAFANPTPQSEQTHRPGQAVCYGAMRM